MACPEGPTYQCSGNSILRTDNGVTLTSSGVQVYGRSTSDLANPNPDLTNATGLAPASGGLAEIRLAKDPNGVLSAPILLLSNLGLTWDGRTERPLIIEIFATTPGRTQLNPNGTIANAPLPPPTDLVFYDFATRGANGTQANYANNRYFPRAEPIRCPAGERCQTAESSGPQYQAGDWRRGGTTVDRLSAGRLHSEGDTRAGAARAPNGGFAAFPGGDGGIGLPNPGTKGYRSLATWAMEFGNLSKWESQDTVDIVEWGGSNEHNKYRRGVVAFGQVTDPAAVPSSGAAAYASIVYGWYSPAGVGDPIPFQATATVNANFATRQVQVNIGNAVSDNAQGTPIPVGFNAVVTAGAVGSNVANYAAGPLQIANIRGGVGVRFFGPVVTTGAAGAGPIEVGGTFQLNDPQTGATVVGGFLGRKP